MKKRKYNPRELESVGLVTAEQAEAIEKDLRKGTEDIALEDAVHELCDEIEKSLCTVFLTPEAKRSLNRYVWGYWSDMPLRAVREARRIQSALVLFSHSNVQGRKVHLPGWPRSLRQAFVYPFKFLYDSAPNWMLVVRLYHHSREPRAGDK